MRRWAEHEQDGVRHTLTKEQEFSIEIPDKEADAIHSGMISLFIMH